MTRRPEENGLWLWLYCSVARLSPRQSKPGKSDGRWSLHATREVELKLEKRREEEKKTNR